MCKGKTDEISFVAPNSVSTPAIQDDPATTESKQTYENTSLTYLIIIYTEQFNLFFFQLTILFVYSFLALLPFRLCVVTFDHKLNEQHS